eukprot:XP_011662665.1 PREDICTED: uncharacterized protein LOC100892660 [Strongylocentrotus purpuratus]
MKKSRSKTPPGLPVAGPSNDGKGEPSNRGRKLDFPAKKPLEGKKFYLELTGPRRKHQFTKLKADVEELGGVVEPFLSKELACVISDRIEAKDVEKISKGVPSGTSPAVSTPSPFHQGRDTTPGAADSPSNVTKDSRIVTRGKAIVQKATKSQMYGTTDVLTNAKNWNIPVKHLDVLLKYLCREKEKLKLSGKDKKKSNKEKSGIKAKERQLTKPYLKAEDTSRRFRPITKEFGTWPRILLDTRKGTCPYDPKTRNESHVQGAERTQDRPDASQRTPDVRQKELSRSQSLSKKAISKAAKQREATTSKSKVAKKGFCEFCSVKYSNLEKHLETEQHKKFVGEKNNYTSLDTMIAQGPNIVRFLEDCVRFQNVDSQSSTPDDDAEDSGTEDEVLLLTEPKTPTKAKRKDTKKAKRKKDPSGSSRRRSLGRSPRKSLGNGTSAERPIHGDDPGQRNLEEDLERVVSNNGVKEKTFLQDACKQRILDHPADEAPVEGGGDVAGVDDVVRPGENRNSGLEDRLSGGDGDVMKDLNSPEISAGASKFSSPGVSDGRRGKGKKRRSGGRRSLSLQLRENRTLPVAPQSAPPVGDGVVQEAQEACTVLRGIAGEEEPIRQEGEEVVIMRIRREDTLQEVQEVRVEGIGTVGEDIQPQSIQPDLLEVANGESVNGNVHRTVQDIVSSVGTPDRRSAKQGSQVITSPGSAKQSRTNKRKRLSAGEADSDDVFTSNPTTSRMDDQLPSKARSGMGIDRNSERQKRKSRRSHADAPPQKVRGRSVRVDTYNGQSVEDHTDTTGSPCIREAQPRVPATHGDEQHSSDDFQQVNTPASGSVKSSGRKNKRARGNRDFASASPENVRREPKQKKSVRNQASTSQLSTAESNNSETDFQTSHPSNSNSKSKKNTSSSAKKGKDTVSKTKPKACENGKEPTNVEVTNLGEATCSVLPSGNSQEETGENVANKSKNQNCPEERVLPTNGETNPQGDLQRNGNLNSQAEQSLELVFRSDLGAEESSFLGFSQDDINETANRSEVFQQQNLDKAALSVYCIPSSDPCPDDDRSSTGSNDFTIGLVLQKVDNFPSEGSEWEEQVTGFMKRLDTQLEVKRRRESELSTLPSPYFQKTGFGFEKENQKLLPGVVEDFGPEHLSDDDDDAQVFQEADENVENHEKDKKSSTRRRSARIHDSSNSRSAESLSYSGLCVSPSIASKKKRNVSLSKKGIASGDKPAETKAPNALRELSPNQLRNSPQKNVETILFSTPKRIKRNLMNTQQSPSVKHIVLPAGTPVEEQDEISNNYVHDDSESEVIFPKFSSPAQKGSIFSPVKHRVKQKQFRSRHRSVPCLGHRDVQSSPLRPSNRHDLLSFAFPPSSRKSLFMKGRVKRINFSSPRKRSKSASSPPSKSSQFLTFLNELRAGLSPTFYTFKKPHFSLRILQPSAVRRHHHCRSKMSRSLLALNLCLPSDAELRIYEFHDDDSVDDEDLVLSPINTDSERKERNDQCTQTPPSTRKKRKLRSRSLSSPNLKGKVKNVKEVEHDSGRKGKRSVKVQASSPDIDSIFDMPPGYYL